MEIASTTEAAHLCLTLVIAVYSVSYWEFSERRFHMDFGHRDVPHNHCVFVAV